MSFQNIYLTKKGAAILAKAQSSSVIHFSHVEIGKGDLPLGVDEKEMEALADRLPQSEAANPLISGLVTKGDKTTISFQFTNEYVTQKFNWKELGVFAFDEDGSRILYAYVNAGKDGDEVLPASSGPMEFTYSVVLTISGTSSVVCEPIDTGVVFATKKELKEQEDRLDDLSVSAVKKNYIKNPRLLNRQPSAEASFTVSTPEKSAYIRACQDWMAAVKSASMQLNVVLKQADYQNSLETQLWFNHASEGDVVYLKQEISNWELEGFNKWVLSGGFMVKGADRQAFDLKVSCNREEGLPFSAVKNTVNFMHAYGNRNMTIEFILTCLQNVENVGLSLHGLHLVAGESDGVYVPELSSGIEHRGANANIFDNGGFQIWQRGNTFNVSQSTIMTADRWKVKNLAAGQSVMVTYDVNWGMRITGTGEQKVNVSQRVYREKLRFLKLNENMVFSIGIKPFASGFLSGVYPMDGYTVSVVVNNQSVEMKIDPQNGLNSILLPVSSFAAIVQGSAEYVDMGVTIQNTSGNFDVQLMWMKLEGENRSSGYVPNSYAQELDECERFYQLMTIPSYTVRSDAGQIFLFWPGKTMYGLVDRQQFKTNARYRVYSLLGLIGHTGNDSNKYVMCAENQKISLSSISSVSQIRRYGFGYYMEIVNNAIQVNNYYQFNKSSGASNDASDPALILIEYDEIAV